MTAGARDQLTRLLTLVPLLHVQGQLRLSEAADTLGVSPETVLADLKVLFMCGMPGGYPDDLIDVNIDALESEEGELRPDGLIRVENADYLARPLRLTPTEATAMIVALRTLRQGADQTTAEIVDRVLAKLETAAAEGSTDPTRIVDPGIAADDPQRVPLAAALRRAVEDRRQVRLSYYVPARDEQSERVVDPRGLVTKDNSLYLDAWCHSAEAPRLFRLDRISSAEVLDSPIITKPETPRDLSDGFFVQDDEGVATLVTLRLEPKARWVREYYAVLDSRELSGDAIEVDLHVADPRWLTRLLLRLAPDASVVAPEEYGRLFIGSAQTALSLYDT